MGDENKHSKIISTCCYIMDNGRVLMLYRNKKEGLNNKQFYRGIGGKAEQGESPIECVKREVKEESGLEIDPIWKGVATFSKHSDPDWEAHIFVAHQFKGNLEKCPEGELRWIDKKELLTLEMPDGDKKLIPYLFEDDKFHAHLIYDDYKNLINSKIDII